MNRGLGILLVIAAAVSIIGYPQGQPASTGLRQANSSTNNSPPSETLERISPENCVVSENLDCNCGDYCPAQDLIDAIREFFPPQQGTTAAASLGVPPDRAAAVKFIVAIVPDPVHTHLSLFFDRSIDAVEQAAQQQGYIFDRATIPWDYQTHVESPDFRIRLRQTRYSKNKEKLPGLMIFRSVNPSKDAADAAPLFVFVVGETPTAGIHKEQFQNALRAIVKIRKGATAPSAVGGNPSKEPLRIMGPTFSGSLYFLNLLLQESEVAINFDPILVHSGTVSSSKATHWFEQSLCNQKVHFATFQESDRYAIRRFIGFATTQGYEAENIAVLSEEETTYGLEMFTPGPAPPSCDQGRTEPNPTDDEKKILQLYFPREISQLRSAYQRDLRSDEPSDSSGHRPVRSTLRLNFEDAGADQDSVPSYSRLQTPLSEEALLLGIVTNLQKHQSQFVIIRATNPLDQLFLVRYLRIAYPEGRIVTSGADMLFRREIENNLLHGTLAITPYSMLPGAEDAVARPSSPSAKDESTAQGSCAPECLQSDKPPRPHTDFVFANVYSAGTYNAMLSLLACLDPKPELIEDCKAAELPLGKETLNDLPPASYAEYGWPDVGGKKERAASVLAPPLLLTALGRYGYWRLALLDSATYDLPGQKSSGKMGPPSNLHSIRRAAAPIPFKTYVPPPWKLLCGIFSGTVLAVIVLMWRGSVASASEGMAILAAVPSRTRRWVVHLTGLLLLTMLLLLLGPWLRWGWCFQPAVWLGWFVLLGVLLIIYWIVDLRRRKAKPREIFSFGIVSGALIILAFCFYMLGPDAQKNLFLYRYVHFASGLSPVLPWILLICSMLWWAWYSLAGLALLDDRRPHLPTMEHTKQSDSLKQLGSCQLTEELNSKLLRAAEPFSGDLRIYLPVFLVALIAAAVVNYRHPVQSLEGKLYDRGYAIAFAIGIFWLLCTLLRLAVTWLECRRLLMGLDSVPLRRSFKWLSGFSWKPIWRLRGSVLQDSFPIIERQMDSLGNLLNLLKDLETNLPVSQDKKTLNNFSARWRPPQAPAPAAAANTLKENESFGDKLRRDVEVVRDKRDALNKEYTEARKSLKLSFRTIVKSAPGPGSLIDKFRELQEKLAETCGTVLAFLQQQWNDETCTATDEENPAHNGKKPSSSTESSKKPANSRRDEVPLATRLAEEFVCLVYVNFILSVLMRMRTMVMAVVGMFVFLLLSIGSYPFEPKQAMYSVLIVLFMLIVGFIAVVYAQMHRDATLSRITDTTPGELGLDFWMRLAGFSAVPLLSLLVAQYPEVNNFLFSWLEPALQGWR